MKKIGLVLTSSVLLFSLTACTKSSITESSTSDTSIQVSSSQSNSLTEESSSSDYFSLMIQSAQSQIPSMLEQSGSMYSDMSIEEGENHTIVYNYTFSEQAFAEVDVEAMKPTMVEAMKPTIDTIKGMIPDVKIEANFFNPDGTSIASFTITQEDTAQLDSSSDE